MASQKTLKLFVYVDGVNDVPSVGDKIIQLGNRSNTARQVALENSVN